MNERRNPTLCADNSYFSSSLHGSLVFWTYHPLSRRYWWINIRTRFRRGSILNVSTERRPNRDTNRRPAVPALSNVPGSKFKNDSSSGLFDGHCGPPVNVNMHNRDLVILSEVRCGRRTHSVAPIPIVLAEPGCSFGRGTSGPA